MDIKMEKVLYVCSNRVEVNRVFCEAKDFATPFEKNGVQVYCYRGAHIIRVEGTNSSCEFLFRVVNDRREIQYYQGMEFSRIYFFETVPEEIRACLRHLERARDTAYRYHVKPATRY